MVTNETSLLCNERYTGKSNWTASFMDGPSVPCTVQGAKCYDSIFKTADVMLSFSLLFLGAVIGVGVSCIVPWIKTKYSKFKRTREEGSQGVCEYTETGHQYESVQSLVAMSGNQTSGSTQQTSCASCTAASSSSNTETVYINTTSPEQMYRNVNSIRTLSRELCRHDLQMSHISHSYELPESSPKVCKQRSFTEGYITPSTPPECRSLSFPQRMKNVGENIGWSRDKCYVYSSSLSTSLSSNASLTVEDTNIDKPQSISSSSWAVDLRNSGHNVKDTANIISRKQAAGNSFTELMTVSPAPVLSSYTNVSGSK